MKALQQKQGGSRPGVGQVNDSATKPVAFVIYDRHYRHK